MTPPLDLDTIEQRAREAQRLREHAGPRFEFNRYKLARAVPALAADVLALVALVRELEWQLSDIEDSEK